MARTVKTRDTIAVLKEARDRTNAEIAKRNSRRRSIWTWFFRLSPFVFLLAAVASGETFTVRTWPEVQKALATTQPDLNIVVSGTIAVEKPFNVPKTIRTFRMVGDKQSSGLSFKLLPIETATNGVELDCENASFFGMTIADFQPSGTTL